MCSPFSFGLGGMRCYTNWLRSNESKPHEYLTLETNTTPAIHPLVHLSSTAYVYVYTTVTYQDWRNNNALEIGHQCCLQLANIDITCRSILKLLILLLRIGRLEPSLVWKDQYRNYGSCHEKGVALIRTFAAIDAERHCRFHRRVRSQRRR